MEEILHKAEATLAQINKPVLSTGDLVNTIEGLKDIITYCQKQLGIYKEPTLAKVIKMFP